MRQVWQFILLHILLRHVFASILRSLRFAISNFRCDKFSPTKFPQNPISTKSHHHFAEKLGGWLFCYASLPSKLMLVSMKFYVHFIRQRLPERNHNQSQHWPKFPPKPRVFFWEGLSPYQVSWETCNDCNVESQCPSLLLYLGIDTWAPGRQLAWWTSN